MNVLMVGLFYPLVSGVSEANELVRGMVLDTENKDVDVVDFGRELGSNSVGDFSWGKIFSTFNVYFSLYKVFKSDVVYLTPGQSFYGVLKYAPFIILGRFLRKSVIIHIHGDYVHQLYGTLNGVKRKIYRFVLSCATTGVVLSELLVRNMSPFIDRDNIMVVRNSVSKLLLNSFDSASDLVESNGKLKLLFLSNIMREKGIFDLLDAISNNPNLSESVELKIAGGVSPEDEDLFYSYVHRLSAVDYVGIVRGEEKKDILDWADVFVLPTYYEMEGQPISILEAMATGCFVISTSHAGIPDILEERGAFIVEKRSSESLSNGIYRCLNDRSMLDDAIIINKQAILKSYTPEHFKANMLGVLFDGGV